MKLPLPLDEDPQQPLQIASPSTSEYESATERSPVVDIPKLDLNGEPASSVVDDYDNEDMAFTARTHQSGDGHRKPKFAWIRRYLSFRGVFHLFGRSVVMYPQAYFIVSFLIASLSYGMRYMVLKDQIRDGYTPTNAPSRFETDVMREFWNASGDPIMTVAIIQAKDNGSMLRPDYFSEVIKFHHYLLHNFTLDYEGEKIKYDQLCSPYCSMNLALDIFYEGLEKQLKLLKEGEPLNEETKLLFPVSEIGGFTVHLERNFFGIKLKEPLKDYEKYVGRTFADNESIDGMKPYQVITNIDRLEVIMMIFRGDRTNPRKGDMLSKWELEIYDWCLEEYEKNDSKFDVHIIGTEVLDQEMIRDGQRLTPFFAAGFGLMFTFVFITVLGTAYYYKELDWGKVIIACGACISPIMAITTTYGLVSWLGFRINSFVLVSPFLICGIGVDDAFLMIHSWQRLAPHGYSPITRFGLIFEEVGPSITITSLTNFISFGIGAITPTPEIRLFCMTTAIAMGMDYIFELIFFGPLLVIATKMEKQKLNTTINNPFDDGWRKNMHIFCQWIVTNYSKFIGNRFASFGILLATATYWYFAIYGAMNIRTRLDSEKILPKDSPIQKPNAILHHTIWAEYHPVTIIVNKPFDITDLHQYNQFWNLVREFETLDYCKGNISSLIWLREYEKYFKEGDMLEGLLGFFGYEKDENSTASLTGVDYSKIKNFLANPFYKHWKALLKLGKNEKTNETIVTNFWFTISYHNTSSWQTRMDLMVKWREIASRYKEDLNVTVWEANGMFVDQMLSLKYVALQTGVLTLLCMAVVCAIFIPNPCSVVTASMAIASISLGVFGFLSWWHFDLDPVTMAALLMSIGLSVDFTAHVSYHYQLTNRKTVVHGKVVKIPINGSHEKLVHTLENIAWPMIQAGTSTIVCILPLFMSKSYAPNVFVKTIILVVSWGMVHGLLVLPAFLGALPDCVTNANCYRTFLSTSSQKSCRYAGPSSERKTNEGEMISF